MEPIKNFNVNPNQIENHRGDLSIMKPRTGEAIDHLNVEILTKGNEPLTGENRRIANLFEDMLKDLTIIEETRSFLEEVAIHEDVANKKPTEYEESAVGSLEDIREGFDEDRPEDQI